MQLHLFFSLRSGRRTIELLYKRNEKIWEYKVLNVTSGFEAPSRISFSHDLKVALKEVTSECEEANGVWQGPRSLSDTSFRATGLLGLLPEEIMHHTLGMCEESVEVRVLVKEQRTNGDFQLQTPIGREETKDCEIICTIPAESRHIFADTLNLTVVKSIWEAQGIPESWLRTMSSLNHNIYPIVIYISWWAHGTRTLTERRQEWVSAGNDEASFPTKAADLLDRVARVIHALLKTPRLYRLAEVPDPRMVFRSWSNPWAPPPHLASAFEGRGSVRLCRIPPNVRLLDRSTRDWGMEGGLYAA
jgi:hypothetical protein